jgi:hypothetical protein
MWHPPLAVLQVSNASTVARGVTLERGTEKTKYRAIRKNLALNHARSESWWILVSSVQQLAKLTKGLNNSYMRLCFAVPKGSWMQLWIGIKPLREAIAGPCSANRQHWDIHNTRNKHQISTNSSVCVSKKGRSRLALPRTTRSPMQCLLTRLDRNVHAPWLDELGPVVLHLLLGLADLRIYTVDKYIPCVSPGQTTSRQ